MAAPELSTVDANSYADDPTDPGSLTPEQRLGELAELLALAARRLSTLRTAEIDPSSLVQIPPQSRSN